MSIFIRVALSVAIACAGTMATAHEYWIHPVEYQVPTGGNLVANLRVGQNFNGAGFAFVPPQFLRFDIVQGGKVTAVTGRIGDLPALNMPPPGDGLAVAVIVTTENILRWSEWQKFVDFVTLKDFKWALDDHATRGLPETGFRESYTRYAKSLIGVGTAQGSDAAVGLETEIVALTNPYTDDLSAGMRVRVLYQGKPRKDAQVEVFARPAAGAEVTVTTVRTDMDGVAVVPVIAGTEYLLDADVLRPLSGDVNKEEPVWESLWASMTFRVPG